MKTADPIQERPAEARLLLAGGVALACAVALAWLVPTAAILVVWPVLFFLPGWWLVARVAPTLSAVGRTGVAVVVSVYASAHFVNAIGTLGAGLTRGTVFGSAVALLLATLALARLERLPGLAPPPRVSFALVRAGLRDAPAAWLIAVGAGCAVGAVLGLSAWHLTPGGWVAGGWNWSDLLVHVSIGKSLMFGNFPPQVPYFSGAALSYHWFADLHGAIAAMAAGADLIAVYVATNGLMAAVLALVTWELAWRITGDRRVAGLAAILALFGGGMGWLRLPLDLAAGKGDIASLVGQGSYDNSWVDAWPYFRIASVFGTGFLAHRATALGLPGLVSVVLLVDASLGRRAAGMALAGLLAALLAPFHFFAFPAVYLVVLLLVVARRGWREPAWRRDAALFLAPVVLALPFVVGPALQQGSRGALRFVLGWSEARPSSGLAGVAFFYLTNLGLPFLLALAAFLRRGLPRRAFLVAWTVALFLMPNLLVVSAVEFDMNKYFQMMWIAVAIAAAWLIRAWPRPLVAAVLAVSVVSPALVAIWHVESTTVALTAPQVGAADWIEANTPERSIFVTDAWINSPVDLAGRLRITSFGPYVANLGYDPTAREADVRRVRCGGPEEAATVMRTYGARYVLSTGGLLDCGGRTPTDLSSSPRFETVYDVDGVTIWMLRPGA